MAASSFGTQLALLFTFVFQVQGELVVQSDNVTFPPYADLPAMFGPPVPAGEERLWGVLKVRHVTLRHVMSRHEAFLFFFSFLL